jgi:hypothetical protein
MPFVYDQTDIDHQDDDGRPPRADQFVYLPAPDYHSVRQPVRFSIVPPEPIEPAPPTPVAAPVQAPAPPPPPVQTRRFSLLNFFRRPRTPATHAVAVLAVSFQERQRQAKSHQEHRTQQLFSIAVPALRAIGVRRVYCRYDGGNDEGFAWFDHYEIDDGKPIDTTLVGQRLGEMKVGEALEAAGLVQHSGDISPGEREWRAQTWGGTVGSMLSHEWAFLLLGHGFGTGEYLMYGAFVADLDECVVSDDPNADPVVENIDIAG